MEEFVGIRSNLSNESKFLKFFRNFDIFTKLEEDIKIRTPLSGAGFIFFINLEEKIYHKFIYSIHSEHSFVLSDFLSITL